jgi:hypothetical protein
MTEATGAFVICGVVIIVTGLAFVDLYRIRRLMDTPEDIRRRMEESLAFLASARQMFEIEVDDHAARVEQIQADCPHENVSMFSGQYVVESTCADCGKFLEAC